MATEIIEPRLIKGGFVLENTQLAWRKVSGYSTADLISNSEKDNKGALTLRFEVTNLHLMDYARYDLSNLVYFFLIADRVVADSSGSVLPVLAFRGFEGIDGKEDFERQGRVLAFLSEQDFREDVRIEWQTLSRRFESRERRERWIKSGEHGRVQPLYRVVADDSLKEQQEARGVGMVSELLDATSNSDFAVSLDELYKGYLDKICISLSPSSKNRAEARKREQYKVFMATLKTATKDLCPLAKCIWGVVYNEIVLDPDKQFLDPDGQSLNKQLLEKTVIDAVSYSEMLYQILENSCIHTSLRSGYFSLRCHRALRDRNLEELSHATQTLELLAEQFKYEANKKNPVKSYLHSSDVQYYLSVLAIDNAEGRANKDVAGILETYPWVTGKRKKELSALYVKDNTDDPPNFLDTVQHYGLYLIYKILYVNDCIGIVETPNAGVTKTAILRRDVPLDKSSQSPPGRYSNKFTSYRLLLPLAFGWRTAERAHTESLGSAPLFDVSMFGKGEIGYCGSIKLLPESLFVDKLCEEAKISKVFAGASIILDAICDIEAATKGTLPEWCKNNRLLTVNFEDVDYPKTEVLAKALYTAIAYLNRPESTQESSQESSNERRKAFEQRFAKQIPNETGVAERRLQLEFKRNLFAVLFSDEYCLMEFVRFFSILYGQNGENPWFGDMQIALCLREDSVTGDSKNETGGTHNPMVCFLLAGNHINHANHSAEVFAYYNPRMSRRFLPLINYLSSHVQVSGQVNTVAEPVAEFPFDLFLDNSCFEENSSNSPRFVFQRTDANGQTATGESQGMAQSMFLQYLHDSLQTEMVAAGGSDDLQIIGCKVQDVNLLLKSGIHIGTFYEAELLFRNVGITYRLAYLMANEIVGILGEGWQSGNQAVVVVGYERYGMLLYEQIVRNLIDYREPGYRKAGIKA